MRNRYWIWNTYFYCTSKTTLLAIYINFHSVKQLLVFMHITLLLRHLQKSTKWSQNYNILIIQSLPTTNNIKWNGIIIPYICIINIPIFSQCNQTLPIKQHTNTHCQIYSMHPCIDSIIPHIMYSLMVSWKVYPMPRHVN